MAAFIAGIILICLAAAAEAIMDKIQFHFDRSIFSDPEKHNQLFWNPKISWKNKWDETLKRPKFFLSTTLLVFLTDAWHLFKFVRNTSIFVGLPIMCASGANIILVIVLARLAYGLVFTAMFDKVLVK